MVFITAITSRFVKTLRRQGILSGVILLLTVNAPTLATNAPDPTAIATGKEFYERDCLACHNALFEQGDRTLYLRAERKVSNFEGLKRQIAICASRNGHNWLYEDVVNVAHYLNHSYYRFKKP